MYILVLFAFLCGENALIYRIGEARSEVFDTDYLFQDNTHSKRYAADSADAAESEPQEGFSVDESVTSGISDAPQPQKTSAVQEIFEWLDVLVTAMIAVVLIFSLLFRVATIQGRSMMQTLLDGQKVIITNLAYTPQRGDIVVISRNLNNSVADETTSDLPIIKRVIALAGQTVDIDFVKGVVYVDGQQLEEDYVNTPTSTKYEIDFPVVVPEGCIFVMGDNRNESLDSRSSRIGDEGMIDTRYILGHAVFRIFPFDTIGGLTSK